MITAAINDVKAIVAYAKQNGLSKTELAIELSKYRNTAMYMHGISKDMYMTYIEQVVTNY